MALVHDTFTRYPATADSTEAITGGAGTGTRTFTHAGSASACGAVLFVIYNAAPAGQPTVPPTYGGIPMTLRADYQDTSEPSRLLIYTLDGGPSFPTGSQSVTIIHNIVSPRWYTVCTMTSTISARARWYKSVGSDTFTGTNPSLTLYDLLVPTFVYGALISGLAAPSGATPNASMTAIVGTDYGQNMARIDRYTNMASTGSPTFDYTAASDDFAMGVACFEEYVSPGLGVINHDIFTRFPGNLDLDSTTGTRSFTHAGASDASGAIVIVASFGAPGYSGTVQYGGVAMTLRASNYFSAHTFALQIFTLDDQVSFPTGTQTVTFDGSTTSKLVVCATVRCSSGYRAKYHTSANKSSASAVAVETVSLTTTATTLIYGAGEVNWRTMQPDPTVARGFGQLVSGTSYYTSVDRYSDAVAAGTWAFGYGSISTDVFGVVAAALEAASAGPTTLQGSVTLTASPTLTVSPQLAEVASLSLTASPTLSVNAIRTTPSIVSLTVSPTLSVDGIVAKPASISLTATPTLSVAAPSLTEVASVSLTASPTLTINPTVTTPGQANLTFIEDTNAVVGTTTTTPASFVGTPANGDFAYIYVVNKPSSFTPATPSGWNQITSAAVGTGTDGVGTGLVRITVFHQVVSGGAVTMPAIACTGTGACIGAGAVLVRPDAGATAGHQFSSAQDTTDDATWNLSSGSDLGVTTGDLVMTVNGFTNNISGAVNANALTGPGLIVNTNTELTDSQISGGNRAQVVATIARDITGTSSGAQTINLTLNAAMTGRTGGVVFIRMRSVTSVTYQGTINLSISPTFTLGAFLALPASISLTATPTLSVDALRTTLPTVTLTASPTLTISPQLVEVASISLTATPTIALDAIRTTPATITLTVTPTLSISPQLVEFASLSLSITPTLSVDALRTAVTSLSLTAAPTLSISPLVTTPASISLTASPSLTVNGITTKPSSLTLTATPTLTVNAQVTTPASISLLVSPTLSIDGVRITPAAISLTILPSLTITPSLQLFASLSLTVAPNITINGVRVAPATVTLIVTPTLVLPAQLTTFASVSLTATPTLSIDATRITPSTVSLTATPTLAVNAFQGQFLTTTLTISPTLSVSPLVTTQASLSLTIVPTGSFLLGGLAAAANLSITPTISISALRTALPTLSLIATPTLSIDALRTALPTLSLSVTPTLLISPQVTTQASISLSIIPTASFAMGGLGASIALSISPTISINAIRVTGATLTLVASPTLSVDALLIVPASISLLAVPTLSISIIRAQTLSVSLSIIPTFSAGVAAAQASLSLTIIPSVSITLLYKGQLAAALTITPTITVGAFLGLPASLALTITPNLTLGFFGQTPASLALIITPIISVNVERITPAYISLIISSTLNINAVRITLPSINLFISPTIFLAVLRVTFASIDLLIVPTISLHGAIVGAGPGWPIVFRVGVVHDGNEAVPSTETQLAPYFALQSVTSETGGSGQVTKPFVTLKEANGS